MTRSNEDPVVHGHGNQAIADRLSISQNTVEWHPRPVVSRFGVRHQPQSRTHSFQDTSRPGLTKDRTIALSARSSNQMSNE